MKKILIIFLVGIFMMSFTSAWINTTFNNSLSEENISFGGDENQTRWLSVPENTFVTTAFLNLSGYLGVTGSNFCYQESANVSDQTGIDGSCGLNYSGSYSFTLSSDDNINDGDWDTFSPGIGYIYPIYNAPSDPIAGIEWKVKGINGATGEGENYSLSIPLSAIGDDGLLKLWIRQDSVFPSMQRFVNWMYFDEDESAIVLLTTGGTTDSNNTNAYEEAINWDLGGYITNPYLEVGVPDGNYEWNFTGTFGTPPLLSGLSAYYNLDNTTNPLVYDSLGITNGTNVGATRGVTGIINNSFNFDGSSQYVGSVYELPYEDYSFSAWINGDTLSGTDTIYSQRKGSGSVNPVNSISIDTSKFQYQLRDNDGLGLATLYSTTEPNTGQWYNIVTTFDQSTGEMKLYVNGTLESSDTYSGGTWDVVDAILIGAMDDPSGPVGNFFDGKIDEIGIWGKVLTADEITELYNSGDGITYPFESGGSDNTQTTTNLFSSINSYLSICTFVSGLCDVPFLFHSDTAGGFGYETILMSFSNLGFAENNQTYSATTTEGAEESFEINISYDTNEYTNIIANLVYNGTSYFSSNVVVDGTNSIFTRSIAIPLFESDVSVDFYWSFDLTNSTGTTTYNSTTNTQSVLNIGLDNCSTHTITLLNYTLVDEDTQVPLTDDDNGTIELDVDLYSLDGTLLIANFSQTFEDTNNASICLSGSSLNFSNYSLYSIARYSGADYSTEYSHIQNLTISNGSIPYENTLYDLLTERATNFRITFKNENFLPVADAVIQVERQYVGEGVFKAVEAPVTSTEGESVAHLVRDDMIYNFIVVKNGQILGTFNNLVAFCENDVSCDIQLNLLAGSGDIYDYDSRVGIAYSLKFNETSLILTFDFTTTDGAAKNVEFYASKFDQLGNTTICSSSLVSASGSLTCVIPPSLANSTLQYVVSVDGVQVLQGFESLGTPIDLGDAGYFLLLILVMTLALMFVESKTMTILAVMVGFITSSMFFFIKGGIIGKTTAIMWLIVSGLILIYQLNSTGRS